MLKYVALLKIDIPKRNILLTSFYSTCLPIVFICVLDILHALNAYRDGKNELQNSFNDKTKFCFRN